MLSFSATARARKFARVLEPWGQALLLACLRMPQCGVLPRSRVITDKASNTINIDLLQVYPGQRANCNPHILLRLLQCLFALPLWLLRGPE